MRRDDVSGFRLLGRYSIPTLISKSGYDYFPLPKGVEKDSAWNAWMTVAPNLDALDEQKILKDASALPNLGTNLQERRQKLNSANRLGLACVFGAFVGIICVNIQGAYTFGAALLIIMPWITLVNICLYGAFFPSPLQQHPDKWHCLVFMISGIGLGLEYSTRVLLPRGVWHTLFLRDAPLCGLTIVIAALAVIFSLPQMKDFFTKLMVLVFLVPLLLLLGWGYGIGLAVMTDTAFDYSKTETFPVKVLNDPKPTKAGLQVKISSWGIYPEDNIGLPQTYSNHVARNDTLCVWAHAGFIAIPWYEIKLNNCH